MRTIKVSSASICLLPTAMEIRILGCLRIGTTATGKQCHIIVVQFLLAGNCYLENINSRIHVDFSWILIRLITGNSFQNSRLLGPTSNLENCKKKKKTTTLLVWANGIRCYDIYIKAQFTQKYTGHIPKHDK
jgi:hypothetical protein